MEPNEIISIISQAFAPYRCVAELWDYEENIRFRVYDKDNVPILTFPELPVASIKDDHDLKSIIEVCKTEIRNKDFKID